MEMVTTLQLAKENFKFSAGHFLIFDEKSAERLHGHNYQVRVNIAVPEGHDLAQGYFIDFSIIKKHIKDRLDQWDEVVLLPKNHPDMKISEEGKSLKVEFRDRLYMFPKNEVVLLPVTNTSVEQLSKLLAQDFYNIFKGYQIKHVEVYVEETRGQGASCVLNS